jgi:hypothetical protein
MKRNIFLVIVLLGLVIVDCYAQAEVILEHKLPPGWKYKGASISQSNTKAIFLIQDISDDILLRNTLPRRLQVLDKDNALISEISIDGKYWLSTITSDNRIFLHDGDESGCNHIKAIDIYGNDLFEAAAEGRWPVFSSKDIALVPGPMDIGPISIIDGYTGREKLRYRVPTHGDKPVRISTFLPFSDDGFYVVGIGATLFLKSYLHQGMRYWKVDDIGGNIESSMYLNDDMIAVSYKKNDFHDKNLMAGIAVIEWRTGNIVFNKHGFQKNGVRDSWYAKLQLLNLMADNDDLMFYGDPDGVISLPRLSNGRKGWDKDRPERRKLLDSQAKEMAEGDRLVKPERAGKYIIINSGDSIRIEKSEYLRITNK